MINFCNFFLSSTEKDANQRSDDVDSSGSETQDKLKDIISKVAEHLGGIQKDDGITEGEGDLNNAREPQIKIYLMDENGQLVDGNEALLKRKKSTSKNEYVEDDNEPSFSDYNDLLESLIAQNIKFQHKKKERSDDYQQSHQARLSLIYEMNYEDDNLDNSNDDKNDKKDN
jgi:hypothetical protein